MISHAPEALLVVGGIGFDLLLRLLQEVVLPSVADEHEQEQPEEGGVEGQECSSPEHPCLCCRAVRLEVTVHVPDTVQVPGDRWMQQHGQSQSGREPAASEMLKKTNTMLVWNRAEHGTDLPSYG